MGGSLDAWKDAEQVALGIERLKAIAAARYKTYAELAVINR
jgi:hypothetical protein